MKFFLKDILIPSANHRNTEVIRKNFRTGRSYIYKENSVEYQEFKNTIRTVCIKSGFKPILKPQNKNKSNRNVSIGLIIFFAKGGKTDLDGNLKCLQDSLNGLCYEDDKQIKKYHHLEIQDYAGFNGFKVEILEIKE